MITGPPPKFNETRDNLGVGPVLTLPTPWGPVPLTALVGPPPRLQD